MKSANAPFNEFGQSMILRDIEDLYIDIDNINSGATGLSARLTALANTVGTITTSVSGLGTMSTQNASAVAITGGAAAGLAITTSTFSGTIGTLTAALTVGNGGTGLTTVAQDRIVYTSALDTFAATAITSFGRLLIACADAAAGRTQLSLGSIATQDSSNVSITGGSITGITDLAVADGGTGSSTAGGARTNLGLGTISTQDANNVNITGGSVTGITDLAVADGGTGASTAANARTNLGLGTMSTQAASAVAITGGTISGISAFDSSAGGTINVSATGTYYFGLTGGTASSIGGGANLQVKGATTLVATSGSTTVTASGGDLILQSDSGTHTAQLGNSSDKVGFYGTSGQLRQTVTGSKGGIAALASLLTKLNNMGLITDSST